MKLVNLTPHAVSVFDHASAQLLKRAGDMDEFRALLAKHPPLLRLPSSGMARVDVERVLVDALRLPEGVIPIYRSQFTSRVHDLPDPQPGVRYVVSAIVLRACPERSDLLVPVEGVRDPHGRIVGCTGFDVREG